jgi:hypothetical protein
MRRNRHRLAVASLEGKANRKARTALARSRLATGLDSAAAKPQPARRLASTACRRRTHALSSTEHTHDCPMDLRS